MIWLTDIESGHYRQVGTDIIELIHLKQVEASSTKGFVIPATVYNDFVDRHAISEVICEIVHELDSPLASKTIAAHFAKTKYSQEEIQMLLSFYHELEKPLSLWAQVINKETGKALDNSLPVSVSGIESFDVFSDAIITSWGDVWSEEQIDCVHGVNSKPRDFGVVIMVQEEGSDHLMASPEDLFNDLFKSNPQAKLQEGIKPSYQSFLNSIRDLFKSK